MGMALGIVAGFFVAARVSRASGGMTFGTALGACLFAGVAFALAGFAVGDKLWTSSNGSTRRHRR